MPCRSRRSCGTTVRIEHCLSKAPPYANTPISQPLAVPPGRPVAPADCEIAAIARARDWAIATRNIRDFADMEIELVDPWAVA